LFLASVIALVLGGNKVSTLAVVAVVALFVIFALMVFRNPR
jgi:hypothetical protein